MKQILLIVIITAVQLFGQLKEFEITERAAPPVPPVFVNNPDDAAVIIYSDISDINFESNVDGIVKITRDTDKYTLIIKTDRQYIKLKKAGFIENRISIPKPEARQAFYYLVQEKGIGITEIPVTIEVDPPDAAIYCDGKLIGTSGAHQLSEGVHKLRIVKAGYKETESDIEVSTKNILFRYKLEKTRPVVLEVKSVPDKAKIFIDNIEEGETDEQIFKMPGTYEVKISKPGYLDFTTKVDVKEKGKNSIEARLEKSSVSLTVRVDPSDADLKMNNKTYTTNTTVELAPGSYLVEIKKSGYDNLEDNITLERGKPLTKSYNLVRQTGSLQIKVKPITAVIELSLAGRVIKTATGSGIIDDLPVGAYSVTVRADGYENSTKNITIKKNEIVEETVTLTEKKTTQSSTTISGNRNFNIEFVEVPGGTFQMGDNFNEGESDEKPVHTVTLSSFKISKYEITFAQYDAFCEATGRSKPGDNGWGRGSRPVINVTWEDAMAFCRWAGTQSGKNITLPTEAEWEFAARGGTSSRGYKFSGSNNIDEVAWYDGNSGSKTHPVGEKRGNELGIYDMSGNVWEWCRDWYDKSYYAKSPERNPEGASTGSTRVLRGGSSFNYEEDCRIASRDWFTPGSRISDYGFRCIEY